MIFAERIRSVTVNHGQQTRRFSETRRHGNASSIGSGFRDDRRDVVALFLGAESLNAIHNCSQQSRARKFPTLLQRFNQAPLTELLSSLVTGFGNAISVKRKHVAGESSCSRMEQS
jgi:hypothetical protein